MCKVATGNSTLIMNDIFKLRVEVDLIYDTETLSTYL